MSDTTTIKVSKATRSRLAKRAKYGDTLESVIKKMLDQTE